MANIPFSLITNATDENNGTGYFDILMKTVNMHVNLQYETNRITGAEYATVYLGAMQSAMAEAMKFALQEQLTEAQVDGVLQDNANKVKEGIKLDSETKLLNDQVSELLLNGAADRANKTKQGLKLDSETALLNDQDSELLLNGAKDRLIKDGQTAKLTAETKLLNDQDSELLANGLQNRDLLKEKTLNEADKRLSTAKARDVQESQRKLYARQLIGFDDSKAIKAFEAQTNAWALFSSSGMDTEMPSVFSDSNLSNTYTKLTTPTNTSTL